MIDKFAQTLTLEVVKDDIIQKKCHRLDETVSWTPTTEPD